MAQTFDFRAKLAQVQAEKRSPEYQQTVERLQAECNRLHEAAMRLAPRKAEFEEQYHAETVRKEFASGSSLHRGFYCPSPVFDIVVGNAKRGKLLKKVTARSKPSHEYDFDAEGRLLRCRTRSHSDGSIVSTEYLVYESDMRYGLCFDAQNRLLNISEEAYHDGRLVHYYLAFCLLGSS